MTSQTNPYGAPLSGPWPAGQLHPADVNFGDAPIATFRSTLDSQFIGRGFDRWVASHRKVNPWLVGVLVGVTTTLFFYVVGALNDPGIGTFLVSLLIGTLSGLGIAFFFILRKWTLKRATIQNFRVSRDFETVHSMAIYRDEFVTLGPTDFTTRRWEIISSGRRFKDGVLIMVDGYHFHWLRWADLVSGTAEDVDTILRANVADYKEVPA